MQKVITIDGFSGVGKGTVSRKLAKTFGWQWLDSGALYRVTALCAQQRQINLDDAKAVAAVALHLPVAFDQGPQGESIILLNRISVGTLIYTEAQGALASKVAAYPEVRAALVALQHSFLTEQGLVADGRDMGTVIFPQAPLKIFLMASAEVRAKRRQLQLQRQGINVNIHDLVQEIEARDFRDRTRTASPVVPAKDAMIIDTSELTAEQVCERILQEAHRVFGSLIQKSV